jgi:protein SCO1/2
MEAAIQSHVRKSNFIERLVSSKLFWVIAVAFLFAYPIVKSVKRQLPRELPVISKLPDFTFTNENGKPFGSQNLKGKVYIANFVFTSCQTVCPNLLAKVQTVQHRIRGVIDRAAIVTFTVDPENDTPEVLYSKAREMKANPNVWRFLTAPLSDTKKLLIEGFKVPMGDKVIAANIMDVAHSNKLVLVDQEGQIRGYYATEKDDLNKMMIDIGLTINRKKESN